LTAVHAQRTSLPLCARNDFLLQQALLRSLGMGRYSSFRDNLRGHWQVAIEPRVEIRFTNPSILDLGFEQDGTVFGWTYYHQYNREFRRPKITAPRLGLQLSMPHLPRMTCQSNCCKRRRV